MKVVSVCVPIYNTEGYLRRCLDSLVDQTYPALEIILVNDGSTDNSGAICDEYALRDKRVRVIHKENGGEATARNAGLRSALGEFIMFCDSDDEYVLNAVELLIAPMAFEGVDMVIGGYFEKSEGAVRLATNRLQCFTAREAAYEQLTSTAPYSAVYILSTVNGKLYRREIIEKNHISFDERFVVGSDTIFECDYLQHTVKIYDIFQPIYIYYKFELVERLQGMYWFYPDAYILSLYVGGKLFKMAKLNGAEFRTLAASRYWGVMASFVKGMKYEGLFQGAIRRDLDRFYDEFEFMREGASEICKKGLRGKTIVFNIASRIISWLFLKRKMNVLYRFLKIMSDRTKCDRTKQPPARLIFRSH